MEFLKKHKIENVTDMRDLKGRKVQDPNSEYEDLYECYRGKSRH